MSGLFDAGGIEFTDPEPTSRGFPAGVIPPPADPAAVAAVIDDEKKPEKAKKEKKAKAPLTIDVKPEEPTPNGTLTVLAPAVPTRPTLFSYLKEHLAIISKLDSLSDEEASKVPARQEEIVKEVEALGAALQANDVDLDRKILGWAAWINGMNLDAEQLEALIARLDRRRTSLRACERAAKNTLCAVMEATQHTRVTAPEWTVYTQASPDSIHIENAEMIPLKFVKDPPPADRIDKRGLLDAINSGMPIPPGVTIKQGRHVRIK